MPTQDGEASVLPSQPWTQDGTAVVTPIPPFPDSVPRTMALDNRPASPFSVYRDTHPLGLVVIPHGHEPSATPAILPVKASSADIVLVTDEFYVDWPDGFVIWFMSR